MNTKVTNQPSERIVATDFIKIGESLKLNRERISLTLLGVSYASMSAIATKFDQYTADGMITDEEKPALQRELDSLERDFGTLRRQARDEGVGDDDRYLAFESAYNRLYALLTKIINSKGTYANRDVYDINTLYSEYTDTATVLGNYILSLQSDKQLISLYFSRIQADVLVSPDAVGTGSYADISCSLLFEGEEQVSVIPVSCIQWLVTGLSGTATSADFTTTESGTMTVSINNYTAEVGGVKSFRLAYNAIGNTTNISVQVTLDSDSMPF